MSELVILFAAAYFNVLALGLQQLNVNYGHKRAAFVTAFFIGIPFVLGVTMLPAAGLPDRIAFLLGGPFGIVSAMWLHPHLVRWMTKPAAISARKQTHVPPRPVPPRAGSVPPLQPPTTRGDQSD